MPVTLPLTSERNLTPSVTGASLLHAIAGTVELLQMEVPFPAAAGVFTVSGELKGEASPAASYAETV